MLPTASVKKSQFHPEGIGLASTDRAHGTELFQGFADI